MKKALLIPAAVSWYFRAAEGKFIPMVPIAIGIGIWTVNQ